MRQRAGKEVSMRLWWWSVGQGNARYSETAKVGWATARLTRAAGLIANVTLGARHTSLRRALEEIHNWFKEM